jgi:hypothetical protein
LVHPSVVFVTMINDKNRKEVIILLIP